MSIKKIRNFLMLFGLLFAKFAKVISLNFREICKFPLF